MADATTGKAMMGTYELVRRLGVGGMGEVWLARQRGAAGFARYVAIKRLLPQAMEQRDVVAMFIEEAQITGRLRHPNVVNVVELGAAESGELYLVLEYVDGVGLHKLLREPAARPSVGATLAVGHDVARALYAAHTLVDDEGKDLGLVHRDVTPSNMMLDQQGHVKLMDFGIAKVRAKTNQTEAGIIKGKIAYLAPEQLSGSPADPRSDLFSLGLVLWESLAGKQARYGSSDAAMMAKVALDKVPPIQSILPDLPAAVAAAVDKACAFEATERFQTGEELAEALVRALEGLPERGRMSDARAELSALVKGVLKKEGPGVTGTTNVSQTVDGERPLALTLHSLVLQQEDGLTLSRPLTDDMIKVSVSKAFKDAQPTGVTNAGTKTRRRRRRNSLAAPVGVMLGVAFVVGGGGAWLSRRNRAREAEAAVAAAGARPARPVVTPPPPPTVVLGTVPTIPPPTVTPPVGPPTVTPPGPTVAALAPGATTGGATGGVLVPPGPHPGPQQHRTSATGGAPHGPVGTGPAELRISVTPTGHLWIDGHDIGDDPFDIQHVSPGAHTIHLANAERHLDRVIPLQLAPGERRILHIDLLHGAQ